MRLTTILATAALSGCSLMKPAPATPVAYTCDAGRGFSVSYDAARDAATIEIAQSRFALQAEPSESPGERYGCDVLTLWRTGTTARVELQGVGIYENCHERQ